MLSPNVPLAKHKDVPSQRATSVLRGLLCSSRPPAFSAFSLSSAVQYILIILLLSHPDHGAVAGRPCAGVRLLQLHSPAQRHAVSADTISLSLVPHLHLPASSTPSCSIQRLHDTASLSPPLLSPLPHVPGSVVTFPRQLRLCHQSLLCGHCPSSSSATESCHSHVCRQDKTLFSLGPLGTHLRYYACGSCSYIMSPICGSSCRPRRACL